jgi:5-methylcytosine-specific restriction protein A
MAKVCGRSGCPRFVERDGAGHCPTHDPGPWGGPTLDERRARTKTREWRELRRQIRERDRNKCWACGIDAPAGQLDHLVPVCDGGTDHTSNLAWICVPCHRSKSASEGARHRE